MTRGELAAYRRGCADVAAIAAAAADVLQARAIRQPLRYERAIAALDAVIEAAAALGANDPATHAPVLPAAGAIA